MTSSQDEKSNLELPGQSAHPVQEQEPLPDTPTEARPAFDLNDFDDEFDDDFEAEVVGEYEMDDDEFARQLVDMVDFEIEGLGELDEDEDEPETPGVTDTVEDA